MTIYYRAYGSTADSNASASNATYATARASTLATTTNSIQGTVGQALNAGPTYFVDQSFLVFDSSAIPVGAGLTINFKCNAPAALGDSIEIRQASAVTNKIAGASLAALTLYGTVAMPSVTGVLSVTLTADPARSTTSRWVLNGAGEANNVAPTDVQRVTVWLADNAGTVEDPFMQLTRGAVPWAFVGVGAAANGIGSSLTPPDVTGAAAGDLMLICVAYRIASTTSVTLPAGWTLVAEQKSNNVEADTTTAAASAVMAYLIRGASAPNLTVTFPVAPSIALARTIAYRNASTVPLDAQTSFTTAANVTAVSGTGLTTTAADDLIVAMCAGGQEAAWQDFSATDPAGGSGTVTSHTQPPAPGLWLERADSSNTTGADTSLAIYDAVRTTAGATGNLIATASIAASHAVIAGAFKLQIGALDVTLDPLTLVATGVLSPISVGNLAVTLDALTLSATGRVAGVGYVGVGTVVETIVAAHTLTEPAGVIQGDLLVAGISSRIASTTSVTLPVGWTLVAEQKNNNILTTNAALPSGTMAYIVRGASAPALTFTHPVAPAPATGRILAYRGMNRTSPLDAQTSFTTATNVTAVTGAGLTTTKANDLLVAMTAGGQEATWTAFGATDPGTNSGSTSGSTLGPIAGQWLERFDDKTTTGNDTSLAMFDAVKTTAGATGNLFATANVAAGHVVIAGAFLPDIGPSGALGVTLDDLTLAGAGTVTTPTRTGTLAVTLDAVTLAGTGTVIVAGSLSVTLGALTLAAAGTVANPPTGALGVTLAPLTLAGTGKVIVRASLAVTLGTLTLAGIGAVFNPPVLGTVTATLAPLTLAGTGRVLVRGALAVTLDDLTAHGTGGEPKPLNPLCTDGLITLYQLDLARLNGPVYFFTSATDFDTEIYWGGQIYTPLPMSASGFEYTSKGAIPQPTVTMSNLFGAGNLLLDNYKGLVGADLVRILTLRRFLDDGESPDPAAYITRDVFVVAQKTSHNAAAIAFKLSARIDQQGTQLPRRQIMRDVCSHIYRFWNTDAGMFDYSRATCPYVGDAAFDINDAPTTWETDTCSRRIAGCQARFLGPLPGRFFPGVGRVK